METGYKNGIYGTKWYHPRNSYVMLTGGAYFIIGHNEVNLATNTFEVEFYAHQPSDNWTALFGEERSFGNIGHGVQRYYDTDKARIYFGTQSFITSEHVFEQRCNFAMSISGISVNGIMTQVAFDGSDSGNGRPFCIGAIGCNNGQFAAYVGSYLKFYHVAITAVDGTLIRDMWPRIVDGIAGLYDVEHDVFYANASSTGQITYGVENEDVECNGGLS